MGWNNYWSSLYILCIFMEQWFLQSVSNWHYKLNIHDKRYTYTECQRTLTIELLKYTNNVSNSKTKESLVKHFSRHE